MTRRIISILLTFSIVFQSTYTVWRAASTLGALMAWSTYSFAEYEPLLPPTITPAPETGPFNAQDEGTTVGISGRNYGLGTSSSDGNKLYLPDGNGGTTLYENDKLMGSYVDGSTFNVADLKNGYGNQGAIDAQRTIQQTQYEAERPIHQEPYEANPNATVTGSIYDLNQ